MILFIKGNIFKACLEIFKSYKYTERGIMFGHRYVSDNEFPEFHLHLLLLVL